MSAFLVLVAGIIAYSTIFTIPLFDYAGMLAGRPALIHAVSFCLHLVNAVLIFVLFRALTGEAVAPVTGMLAGLFFVLHPACTEAVVVAENVLVLLSTTFVLLSLCLFTRATESQSVKTGAFAASLFCFVVAWLADSSAIIVPPLVLVIAFCLRDRASGARRFTPQFCYWAVAIVLVATYMAAGRPFPVRVPNVMGFTEYLRLLAAPTDLSASHLAPAAYSIMGLTVLAALLVLAVMLRSVAVLSVVWVTFSLLWVSGTAASVQEKNVYLSAAGVALMIPWAFSRIRPQAARVAVGLVVAGMVFVLAGATLHRNTVWHDGTQLWSDAVAKTSQKDAKALSGLGRAYLLEGYLASDAQAAQQAHAKAAENLRLAVSLEPDDEKAAEDLGIALVRAGKPEEALTTFKDVVRKNINSQTCLAHIGDLTFGGETTSELDDAREAIPYYRKAHELKPLTGHSLARYAMALVAVGDLATAEGLLTLAVDEGTEQSRSLQPVLNNVQDTLKKIESLDQQATPLLLKNSNDANGLKLRAQALALQSDFQQAVLVLDKLRRTSVPDFSTWLMAGSVWAKRGETDQFILEWSVPPTKPASVSAWTELAKKCASAGMWDAAFEYLSSEPSSHEGIVAPYDVLQDIGRELNRAVPEHLSRK